jgi:hypothetical protein
MTIVAAAAATGSTLGSSTVAGSIHPGLIAAFNQSIAPAFNQLVQNQSVLQDQIAAISMSHPPPAQTPPPQFLVPLVPQVAFPMHQPFAPSFQHQQFQPAAGQGMQGQYAYSRGNQGGRGGHGNQGGSRDERQRYPSFASQICTQNGQGQLSPHQGYQGGRFAPPNPFGGMGPFATTAQAPPATNAPSPIKKYSNWNACFLYGFDIEDAHRSTTCPFMWHKLNHQVGYTRDNAALYVAYGPSTKGQHKMQFPPR